LIGSHAPLPDMFVCANDEMAIGIMETMQKAGYVVPKDFGISGFDDIELSSYVTPRLSSIKIDHFGWGKAVAKTILKLLKVEKIEINKQMGKIMIRESF
jgi:LacI family transcriptional regulator